MGLIEAGQFGDIDVLTRLLEQREAQAKDFRENAVDRLKAALNYQPSSRNVLGYESGAIPAYSEEELEDLREEMRKAQEHAYVCSLQLSAKRKAMDYWLTNGGTPRLTQLSPLAIQDIIPVQGSLSASGRAAQAAYKLIREGAQFESYQSLLRQVAERLSLSASAVRSALERDHYHKPLGGGQKSQEEHARNLKKTIERIIKFGKDGVPPDPPPD